MQVDYFRVDPFSRQPFTFEMPEADSRYYNNLQKLAQDGLEDNFDDVDAREVGGWLAQDDAATAAQEGYVYDGVNPGTFMFPRPRPMPLDATDLS